MSYRGLEVKTCPLNCEGFQILQTLKLLEATELRSLGHNTTDDIHWLSEAMKLATADRVASTTRDELTARGHALELIGDYSMLVGGGQGVMIDPQSAARLAGADPRRDGYALAY